MKTKKPSKSKPKPKAVHILHYVEDTAPKMKKFATMKAAEDFVNAFQAAYPDHMASHSGFWIDFLITDVRGDVHFFTDGIDLD